jgi:hypothetical protein
MHQSPTCHRAHRPAPAVISVLLTAFVLQACGSTTSASPEATTAAQAAVTDTSEQATTTTVASASSTKALSPKDAAVAFAQCMRENGVDMKDPGPDGRINIQIGPNGSPDKVDAATKKCQPLMGPGEGGGDTGAANELKEKFLAMAKCVRANGFPDFPDPQITNDNGRVKVLMKADPSTENDPAFATAQERCTKEAGLPGPGVNG